MLKVDFGVHVKGRIVDSAFTLTWDHTYDKLLEAVQAATNAGIRVSPSNQCSGSTCFSPYLRKPASTYDSAMSPNPSRKPWNPKVGGSMIMFTSRSRGDRSVTRNPQNYSKTRITLNTYRTNTREVRAWRGATAERTCLFFPPTRCSKR